MNEGTAIQMWTCNGFVPQDWRIEPLGNGTVRLRAVINGHCLEVANGSGALHGLIRQWACNASPAQTWWLQR